METSRAIRSRRSIRNYTNDVISEENLERILNAAKAAPVARAMYENIHLTIVTNAALLQKIDQATAAMMGDTSRPALYGAPMLIVVSVKIDNPVMENPMWSSAACMVENMALEAVNLGIGSVHIWGAIRAVNQDPELLKALELPEGFTPCCAIALGQTEEEYEPRDIRADKVSQNFVR